MKHTYPRVFIVAGMPRCGTTFLYNKLQDHPSIFVPFRKETGFFSTNYAKGIEWYQSLYRKMSPAQIGADITPYYFLHDKAIERIKGLNPETKVVLGVRDPAEFALSLYDQFLSHTYGVPAFKDFLLGFTWRVGGEKLHLDLKDGFITRRIGEYRGAFGNNLLLFDFKLLQRDPLAVLQAIESFLEIPGHFNEENFENVIINAGNRRNIKVISYLLSRESLISALDLLLPRRLVVSLRSTFDRASESKKAEKDKDHSLEDIRRAEEFFAKEGAAIKEIFADSGIQRGSGAPLIAK
jgi:hypothetical protein